MSKRDGERERENFLLCQKRFAQAAYAAKSEITLRPRGGGRWAVGGAQILVALLWPVDSCSGIL